MRGPTPRDAKVTGRLHEARAKKTLPHAIRGHAGRERILRVDQPTREREAVARGVSRERRQHRRRRRGNFLAELRILTPREHVSESLGVFFLLHDQRHTAATAQRFLFAEQTIQLRRERQRRGIAGGHVMRAQGFLLRCRALLRRSF